MNINLPYYNTLTDADCVHVNEVGQFLIIINILVFPLVNPDADKVWVHELCPHRPQQVIDPILHKGQLPGIEDHTHLISTSGMCLLHLLQTIIYYSTCI